MSEQMTFLLIGCREQTPAFENLSSALTSLGELQILPEQEAMRQILRRAYRLVVVDAAAVDDEQVLVSRVRAQLPQARIVVVAGSPTWRRARGALQAGAVDYVSKTLSEKEFVSVFERALAAVLPTRP